ncbi:hypothetical protein J4436_03990 [Candidatus Woesearchaeota archaeon]|nr:hypothetical protein [Candidatus Woesearchaeota archaeon]
MQLSKLENKIYEGLKKNKIPVFKSKDLCILFNIDKIKAYNLIKSLKRKDIIKNVGKGFLAFKDVNEFIIGQNLNYPCYLSFLSALNYYAYTDQLPKKIYYVTTKYSKEINNFKYITFAKNKFFGYIKFGDLIIAEKEKVFIDSLLYPKYSGGIKEIIKCFNVSIKELDKKKLIDYAYKTKNKALLRRLGFILEMLKFNENILKKLRKNTGNGYELLDPDLKKKNNFNKKWMLDINC